MQRLETAIKLSACSIGDILLFIVTTLAVHSITFFFPQMFLDCSVLRWKAINSFPLPEK